MRDVIKQNELELANTACKIQPNKADSFFCFLLFVQSFNCLYLRNQMPNLYGVFIKLKPKHYPNKNAKTKKQTKNKNKTKQNKKQIKKNKQKQNKNKQNKKSYFSTSDSFLVDCITYCHFKMHFAEE